MLAHQPINRRRWRSPESTIDAVGGRLRGRSHNLGQVLRREERAVDAG